MFSWYRYKSAGRDHKLFLFGKMTRGSAVGGLDCWSIDTVKPTGRLCFSYTDLLKLYKHFDLVSQYFPKTRVFC